MEGTPAQFWDSRYRAQPFSGVAGGRSVSAYVASWYSHIRRVKNVVLVWQAALAAIAGRDDLL
jgi:hypothetical protein